MIWKAILILSLALTVFGKKYAVSEHHIKIEHKQEHHAQDDEQSHGDSEEPESDAHHGELSHIGSKQPEHHEEYAWAYPSYEFSYKVHDPHTHDIKGQEEHRDGDKVKGEYWLIEPNGQKRTVKYLGDKYSGFHATVQYSDDYHYDKKEETNGEEAGEGGEQANEEENSEAEQGNEGEENQESENSEAGEEGGDEAVVEGGDGEESRGHEDVGKWIHDRFWGHRNEKNRYEMKYDEYGNDKHYNGYKKYNQYENDKHSNGYQNYDQYENDKHYNGYQKYDQYEDDKHYNGYKKYDKHEDDKHSNGYKNNDHHVKDYSHGHKNTPYVSISKLAYKNKAGYKADNFDMSRFGLGSYNNRHGEKDSHDDYESHQESRARPAYHGLDTPDEHRREKKKTIVRENYENPHYYKRSASQINNAGQ